MTVVVWTNMPFVRSSRVWPIPPLETLLDSHMPARVCAPGSGQGRESRAQTATETRKRVTAIRVLDANFMLDPPGIEEERAMCQVRTGGIVV